MYDNSNSVSVGFNKKETATSPQKQADNGFHSNGNHDPPNDLSVDAADDDWSALGKPSPTQSPLSRNFKSITNQSSKGMKHSTKSFKKITQIRKILELRLHSMCMQ
jgi:hypothetical protein